jgi:hypothetical protein
VGQAQDEVMGERRQREDYMDIDVWCVMMVPGRDLTVCMMVMVHMLMVLMMGMAVAVLMIMPMMALVVMTLMVTVPVVIIVRQYRTGSEKHHHTQNQQPQKGFPYHAGSFAHGGNSHAPPSKL